MYTKKSFTFAYEGSNTIENVNKTVESTTSSIYRYTVLTQ